MNPIDRIQDEIIKEFSAFDEWESKYRLLIEMGNNMPSLPEKYKTANNLIDGCQSRVWLHADFFDDKIIYQAESDSLIARGIIFLLIRVLSNHSPEEILDANLYFIDATGLKAHLTPIRSNGLIAMLKQMKLYALAFKTTIKQ